MSNGCIITFVVSLHTGDIDRVVIDKSLVGKLSGDNPSHGRLHFQIHVYIYSTPGFKDRTENTFDLPSTRCLNIILNTFSVITTESFLLIAYPDKPRVDYVYFSKKPAPTQGVVKVEKLNSYEPKVSNFNGRIFLLEEKYEFRQIRFTSKLFVQIVSLDLPGPIGRKLHRKLAINIHYDLVRIIRL